MVRNTIPVSLLTAAVGVVVIAWLGLLVAGRRAWQRHRRFVLRAVVLVAALCILAATVALGGMKWSW